jgi:CPA2 family monovalent cation:H+ antiporter-2
MAGKYTRRIRHLMLTLPGPPGAKGPMPQSLQLTLILLAAAVIVVVVGRFIRLPPILGYLIVGVAVGPNALGWIPDDADVRFLAEFGVVFLMFSVGLEFSLTQMHAMRRAVFGLGLAQVAVTTLAGAAALELAGYDWKTSLALGAALAMSSTAIVSRIMAERNELASPQGRQVMGILLFQDLAVVLFLAVIPALAGAGEELTHALGAAVLKAALALTLILFLGQRPMRAWFRLVAGRRASELFVLNALLVTLGLAALTGLAGLSYALGAFLAGMLIAETEFRYQVEDDIKPFRDVLLGLFFITVGMSLDLRVLAHEPAWVLGLLVAPVALKLLVVVLVARAFGTPLGIALRMGFYLAQAGELALVLLSVASLAGLVPATLGQPVLAAMVLSMLAAPLMILVADPVARRIAATDWLARAAELTAIAAQTMGRQDHVIVCGYGRSGQNLVRLLEREDVRYIALDVDPYRVREAARDGGSVVYGDASRREALVSAGIARARALVITFADTATALRILHHVRALRADLPVIVRTVDDSEIDRLVTAGATEVVPEVLEGSLMLAAHSLLVLGVPLARVLANIRRVREERYSLFRGFFPGVTDTAEDALDAPRLHTVVLAEGAHAAGRTLAEVALPPEVEVTGVRRGATRSVRPGDDWRFAPGDAVVLLGTARALRQAEERMVGKRATGDGR